MIYTHIPYDVDKNLGAAYNRFMELLGDDDWACFLDHDAMFTTDTWYKQLQAHIDKHPNGTFYGVTNRVGNHLQVVVDAYCSPFKLHDIVSHRKWGREQARLGLSFSLQSPEEKRLLSGVVILISKKIWKEVKGFRDGFLGVDNELQRRCVALGNPVFIMRDVYVYHWYREKE